MRRPNEAKTVDFKMQVNGKLMDVILDTGSPISLMPENRRDELKLKNIRPPPENREFVDLNNNEVKINGTYKLETTLNSVTAKLTWWEINLDTTPILGIDNFEKMGLKVLQDTEDSDGKIRIVNVSTKNLSNKNNAILEYQKQIEEQFKDLFTKPGKIKGFKYKVQYKDNMQPFQQKGRKIPLHLQQPVADELKKLQEDGHIEKLEEIGEDICVSPAVIAKQSNGTVKIAIDAKELNKQIVKKRMQMPNLDDLRDSISIKISSNDGEELWISTIDLECAFGQVELDEDTAKHCVVAIVGGENTGHYRFKRGFYGLADMTVVFQERLDRLLQRKVPAWQDDMLIVTRGNMEQHYTEVTEVLAKVQEVGYKASIKESEFFKKSWNGVAMTYQRLASSRKHPE